MRSQSVDMCECPNWNRLLRCSPVVYNQTIVLQMETLKRGKNRSSFFFFLVARLEESIFFATIFFVFIECRGDRATTFA